MVVFDSVCVIEMKPPLGVLVLDLRRRMQRSVGSSENEKPPATVALPFARSRDTDGEARRRAIEVLLAVGAPSVQLQIVVLPGDREAADPPVAVDAVVVAPRAGIGRGRNRVDAVVDPQARALGEVLREIDGRAEDRDAARVLEPVELDVHFVVLRPVRGGDRQGTESGGNGQGERAIVTALIVSLHAL